MLFSCFSFETVTSKRRLILLISYLNEGSFLAEWSKIVYLNWPLFDRYSKTLIDILIWLECNKFKFLTFRNFTGPLRHQLIRKNGWKFDCTTETRFSKTGIIALGMKILTRKDLRFEITTHESWITSESRIFTSQIFLW